jgi:hypothetical protein
LLSGIIFTGTVIWRARMGKIKSAREIAQEKVEKLEKATEGERLKWKYFPEGEKLAARYLKQECNLAVELGKYENEAREFVSQGAGEVLLNNIDLPKDDLTRQNNRRAMEGLKGLKNDKIAVENVYSKMRHIFQHYSEGGEQQRKQAYEALKADFEARARQAIQQQVGFPVGGRIDVEKQPQFQEEWRHMRTQIDSQYRRLLDEYKQELSSIP